MKPLKLQKKITLKKHTVVSLGNALLEQVKGGGVQSSPFRCPTQWYTCWVSCQIC